MRQFTMLIANIFLTIGHGLAFECPFEKNSGNDRFDSASRRASYGDIYTSPHSYPEFIYDNLLANLRSRSGFKYGAQAAKRKYASPPFFFNSRYPRHSPLIRTSLTPMYPVYRSIYPVTTSDIYAAAPSPLPFMSIQYTDHRLIPGYYHRLPVTQSGTITPTPRPSGLPPYYYVRESAPYYVNDKSRTRSSPNYAKDRHMSSFDDSYSSGRPYTGKAQYSVMDYGTDASGSIIDPLLSSYSSMLGAKIHQVPLISNKMDI